MSSKFRFLIITLFVLIFLVMSPFIILYGCGYRFDFNRRRFTKTGNLFVTSFPSNALVLINGQSKKGPWYEPLFIYKKLPWVINLNGRTPANINGILPGKYEVIIQKPGYQNWKKQVEIFPEKTTNLNKIKLFLIESIIETKTGLKEIANLWLSPQKSKIIFQKTNGTEVYSYSLINNQIETVGNSENEIKKIEWADDENWLILITDKTKRIINLSNQKIIWTENSLTKFRRLKWPKNKSNFIYGQKDNFLYRLDLKEPKEKLLFNFAKFIDKKPLRDWFVSEPDIYWLKENQTSTELASVPLNAQNKSALIKLSLPDINLNFYNCPDPKIICLTGKNYFWILQKNELAQTLNILFQYPLNDIVWFSNNLFLGYNNYEILIGELKNTPDNNKPFRYEIIFRTSLKIVKSFWYPTGDWIIFQTEDGLYSLELSNGQRNINQLLKNEKLFDFWLTEMRFIWLLTKENNNFEILKVRIQ